MCPPISESVVTSPDWWPFYQWSWWTDRSSAPPLPSVSLLRLSLVASGRCGEMEESGKKEKELQKWSSDESQSTLSNDMTESVTNARMTDNTQQLGIKISPQSSTKQFRATTELLYPHVIMTQWTYVYKAPTHIRSTEYTCLYAILTCSRLNHRTCRKSCGGGGTQLRRGRIHFVIVGCTVSTYRTYVHTGSTQTYKYLYLHF